MSLHYAFDAFLDQLLDQGIERSAVGRIDLVAAPPAVLLDENIDAGGNETSELFGCYCLSSALRRSSRSLHPNELTEILQFKHRMADHDSVDADVYSICSCA